MLRLCQQAAGDVRPGKTIDDRTYQGDVGTTGPRPKCNVFWHREGFHLRLHVEVLHTAMAGQSSASCKHKGWPARAHEGTLGKDRRRAAQQRGLTKIWSVLPAFNATTRAIGFIMALSAPIGLRSMSSGFEISTIITYRKKASVGQCWERLFSSPCNAAAEARSRGIQRLLRALTSARTPQRRSHLPLSSSRRGCRCILRVQRGAIAF